MLQYLFGIRESIGVLVDFQNSNDIPYSELIYEKLIRLYAVQ